MYGNPIYNSQMYQQDLQNMRDRIDKQLNQMQIPNNQQTPITQNFQLAPFSKNGTDIKYVQNIEDVKKELVFNDSIFVDKDFNNMWLKNTKGEIRIFSIIEVEQKDEKDIEIENLKYQIKELKGMIENDKYVNANVDESIASEKSSSISDNK